MAFRFQINLVRHHVARKAFEQRLLAMTTICLCLLAGLLAVIVAVYLLRGWQAKVYQKETRLLLETMAAHGVKREQPVALRKQADQTGARLQALEDILVKTSSWPHVLAALAEACRDVPVRLIRLRSQTPEGAPGAAKAASVPSLEVSGVCLSDNPSATVQTLLARLAAQERFGRGALGRIGVNKDGETEFTLRVPLEVPGLASARAARVVAGGAAAAKAEIGR